MTETTGPETPQDDDLERAAGLHWSRPRVAAWMAALVCGGGALVWACAAPQSLPWGIERSGPMDAEARVVESGEIEDFLEREMKAETGGQRHRGEEGKMGRPTSKNKSGLYAMKGPHDAWGSVAGSEIGESYGVGGLGLVGTGRGGGGTGTGTIGLGHHSDYGGVEPSPNGRGFVEVAEQKETQTSTDDTSTFSIDVDTAAYSIVRGMLRANVLPPAEAVRIEELINYFDYDYEQPSDASQPFAVHAEVGPSPWNPGKKLVHVGVQGRVPQGPLPARNLVFLVDVSGSMMDDQKLPLLVRSLGRVVDQLRPEDRVSLVVYAGASGVVLEPTTGDQKDVIRGALDRLTAGGSTNGGAGIELAYRLAEQNFAKDGINRVILASDGDFNVGIADIDGLEKLIAEKRESGVFLSVLGFGSEATNDATMEALADKGNGNYSFIDSDREARKVLVDEVDSTLVTIAKDVKLQVSFDPKEVKSWRLIGYDNRRLAARDFDDDTKDAGEVGAGHSVTAIYEITPTRELRPGDELMTVAVRYKEPDGDESTRSSFSVVDRDIELSRTSEDFRFAAAVAEVGLLLRKSEHAGSAGWASALELAEGARGEDASCLRDEFVQLMRKAAVMSGAGLSPGGDAKCSA